MSKRRSWYKVILSIFTHWIHIFVICLWDDVNYSRSEIWFGCFSGKIECERKSNAGRDIWSMRVQKKENINQIWFVFVKTCKTTSNIIDELLLKPDWQSQCQRRQYLIYRLIILPKNAKTKLTEWLQ
jgi:hypothetical protein